MTLYTRTHSDYNCLKKSLFPGNVHVTTAKDLDLEISSLQDTIHPHRTTHVSLEGNEYCVEDPMVLEPVSG